MSTLILPLRMCIWSHKNSPYFHFNGHVMGPHCLKRNLIMNISHCVSLLYTKIYVYYYNNKIEAWHKLPSCSPWLLHWNSRMKNHQKKQENTKKEHHQKLHKKTVPLEDSWKIELWQSILSRYEAIPLSDTIFPALGYALFGQQLTEKSDFLLDSSAFCIKSTKSYIFP